MPSRLDGVSFNNVCFENLQGTLFSISRKRSSRISKRIVFLFKTPTVDESKLRKALLYSTGNPCCMRCGPSLSISAPVLTSDSSLNCSLAEQTFSTPKIRLYLSPNQATSIEELFLDIRDWNETMLASQLHVAGHPRQARESC